MESAQLLQWLIPVTGALIAALWGHLLFDVRRLRDKLESLEARVNGLPSEDALLRLTDKLDEKAEKLQREVNDCYRECLRSSYPRERFLSAPSQRSADAIQQVVQLVAQSSDQPSATDSPQEPPDSGGAGKAIREKFEKRLDTNKYDDVREKVNP